MDVTASVPSQGPSHKLISWLRSNLSVQKTHQEFNMSDTSFVTVERSDMEHVTVSANTDRFHLTITR